MPIPEQFKNYFWGENKLFFPDEEFVIKLSYPRIFVRYKVSDAMTDFESFFEHIAEIQYLDGERPSEREQQKELVDIWNYIALEERQLDNDLDDAGISEFFENEY